MKELKKNFPLASKQKNDTKSTKNLIPKCRRCVGLYLLEYIYFSFTSINTLFHSNTSINTSIRIIDIATTMRRTALDISSTIRDFFPEHRHRVTNAKKGGKRKPQTSVKSSPRFRAFVTG